MRRDPKWMDAVVESLGDNVYVTIDVDGMDPAIMPSTGTPEPGGLVVAGDHARCSAPPPSAAASSPPTSSN